MRDGAGADVAVLAGHRLTRLFHVDLGPGPVFQHLPHFPSTTNVEKRGLAPNQHQSARSATAGSICMARRAGTRHAISETVPNKPTTTKYGAMLTADTPNNKPASSRAVSSDNTAPSTSPSATCINPSPRMPPRTRYGLAPIAIRTPISRVRWLTEWLSTPKTPIAASINAAPAKADRSHAMDRGAATEVSITWAIVRT